MSANTPVPLPVLLRSTVDVLGAAAIGALLRACTDKMPAVHILACNFSTRASSFVLLVGESIEKQTKNAAEISFFVNLLTSMPLSVSFFAAFGPNVVFLLFLGRPALDRLKN